MVRYKWVALVAVGSLLGGCATMRGAPINTLDEDKSGLRISSDSKLITRDEIIGHYVGLGNENLRREFRNRVIDHYMGLIDRNYENFSQELFTEGVGVALGFDMAIIGLSATANLFEESADDLATAISSAAGIRSAIDKNLYFDRTLPALIVTMDAQRSKVEVEIIERKGQSIADYSLEAAIRDLRRYQQAGTIMRSIAKVTENASVEAKKAEQIRASILPVGCAATKELFDAVVPIAEFNLDQYQIIGDTAKSATEKDKAWKGLVYLATMMNQDLNEKIAIPAGRQAPNAADKLAGDIAAALDNPDEEFCKVAEITELARQLSVFTGGQ